MISAEGLSSSLAERLQTIAPPDIRLSAQGTQVLVADQQGSWTATELADMAAPGNDLGRAVIAVLESVQDFVSEYLKEPWPQADDPRKFLEPFVDIAESQLRCGYAGETEQVVLEPIAL